jgi:hypothetical protein
MTARLNLLSYRRNLRRRSTSKSDYTRWLGPSWAPISDRAAAESAETGVACRLAEVRHFGNIANGFEAVVTPARRFARQRVRSNLSRSALAATGRRRIPQGF